MNHDKIILKLCQEVQDLILDEFPKLCIFFIPYRHGEEMEAFRAAQERMIDHPALPSIADALERHPKPFAPFSQVALGPCKPPFISLFSNKKQRSYGGCVFVPRDVLDTQGLEYAHLFAAAYPIICRYLKNEAIYGYNEEANTDIMRAQNNMISDWFGVLATSLIKRRQCLQRFAKMRCDQVFEQRTLAQPELFPTPIAIDAATIILEDNPTKARPDNALIMALSMVKEIKDLIKPHYIEKWIDFSNRAQKLLWAGTDPLDILGMAIHTSEDVDIRAISNIVATTMKVSANLSTYFHHYNSFTEIEANERHHKTACRDLLKTILLRLERGQPFDFKGEFQQQNLMLIKGNPMGWCAPALAEALNTIKLHQERVKGGEPLSKDALIKEISTNFENIVARVSWNDLRRVYDAFYKQKRNGFHFTGDSILELIEPLELKSFGLFKQVFAPYGAQTLHSSSAMQADEERDSLNDLKVTAASDTLITLQS